MSDLELFDSKGHFVMPSEQAIAGLDEDKRNRFEQLRIAALTLEATEDALKAAQADVADKVNVVKCAHDRVERVRGKTTAHDAYRQWLATERAHG